MISRKSERIILSLLRKVKLLRRDTSGVLIVITALMFPFLLAFMALALDVGVIYDLKRRQQKAADAGAIGAGHELWRQNTTYAQVERAAKDDTMRNGFDDDDPNVTVTVTYPYTFNGSPNFLEVQIEEVVSTYFARVFGQETVTVRSRAVSGLVAHGDACIFVMDPDDQDAFRINGNATLLSECGIYVNSDDENSAGRQGGDTCLDVPEMAVVGTMNMVGGNPDCTSGYVVDQNTYGQKMPRLLDPLAHLNPPDTSGLINRGDVQVSNGEDVTLLPGIYDDIRITGGTVTFTAGLYVIDGGDLWINGGTTDGTAGVTIYMTSTEGIATGNKNKWGSVNIAGNGVGECADGPCGSGGGALPGAMTLNPSGGTTANAAGGGGSGGTGGSGGGGGEGRVTMVAPVDDSAGGIPGMLFYFDRRAPSSISNKVVGDSCSTFEGGMYFPSTDLAARGTSTADSWQLVVANTFEVMGTSCMYNSFGGNFNGMPPVRQVTLVE